MAPATTRITSDTRSEAVETLPSRPKRSELERAIRDEAVENGVRCSRRRASHAIGVLCRATQYVRKSGYTEPYTLTKRDMTAVHDVLDVIMPDDVSIPAPGSAHELAVRYLAKGNELSIVHTSSLREGRRYCQLVTVHELTVATT